MKATDHIVSQDVFKFLTNHLACLITNNRLALRQLPTDDEIYRTTYQQAHKDLREKLQALAHQKATQQPLMNVNGELCLPVSSGEFIGQALLIIAEDLHVKLNELTQQQAAKPEPDPSLN